MKKSFFSSMLFATIIASGSMTVVSCADYDEDIHALSQMIGENAKLQDALQQQVNGLEGQIKALQDALAAMKSCQCGDIDARIADQINKALSGLNYTTPEDVANAINNALAGLNTGLTEAEVQALIEAYHNAHPSCKCGDLEELIKEYLADNPGLTESDVKVIIEQYMKDHPTNSLTEGDVKAIIETYINNLQHFTKEQIESMINTAIAQALANYECHCKNGLSSDEVAAIASTVIEQYMKDHPYTLDVDAVQSIVNTTIQNSEVINNISSSLTTLQNTVTTIKNDLENLKNNVYTKDEVKTVINTLIQSAIAELDLPASTLSDGQKDAVNALINLAINEYAKSHPECKCGFDQNALNDIVKGLNDRISALEGKDHITNKQLEDAIKEAKDYADELLKNAHLEDYVKNSVYVADITRIDLAINDLTVKVGNAIAKADKNEQAITDLTKVVEDLNKLYIELSEQLDEINKKAIAAYNRAISNYTEIQTLKKLYNELLDKMCNCSGTPSVPDNYEDMVERIKQLEEQIKGLGCDCKIDEMLKDYLTKEEINKLISGFLTKEEVEEMTKDFISKDELDKLLDEYITSGDFAGLTKDFVTKSELEDMLKDYLTPEQLDEKIKDFVTKSELESTKKDLEGQIEDAKKAAELLLIEAKTYADDAAATAAGQALKDANKYTDTKIGEITKAYKDADEEIRKEIKTLSGKIDKFDDRFKEIEDEISEIKKVTNYVAKLITSIELQGTHNPAFGYFALPVGISSNVLIAYYGENEHDTYFPGIDDYDLVYGDPENWITEADYARLDVENLFISGGTTLTNEEGNAGKIYLTVNPSSVDFTGTNFKLVNSLGEESPVVLGNIKPSTDRLSFGQTRSTVESNSNLGFYEATATVPVANIEDAKFKIHDQFETALKEVAEKKLSANLSNVAQAIYNQFNGVLDAYAVQANWKDDLGEHTVTSRYGIAATAIKPLSYTALKGEGHKLPIITPLSDRNINLKDYIDTSKFKIDLSDLDLDVEITVDFSNLNVHEDGSIWSDITVTEANKSYEKQSIMIVSPSGVYTDPVTHENTTFENYSKSLAVTLCTLFNDRADAWSAQLIQEFDTQLGKLNGKVVDVMAKINGQLSGSIDDILGGLQNKLNSVLGVADDFIVQLNKVISRLNVYLENPNLRMQGHILFQGSDTFFHPMSTAKGMPTTFTGTGAIELILTSYTGEILAPAYKKYVAVTNVYKDGKDADSDPALMSALKAANSVDYFDEIIDGERYAVAFQPDASLTGATYELVFSALDFQGKISQRKFYVKVN